ncbi:DUF397 domain-containing protein [Streptomyces sp. CT34]|uniref:DUF397 domain-containing protein n=1 Tax=Streptomyces sp. CT34 TaxID=1553907 RepID=UPI0005B80153|nr:DUF397 domain-containing protein [Streptomyces sp. CT34]
MNSELVWRKSSYSGSAGGDCVEVALSWGKSSYSASEGGECVEVAISAAATHVYIRDSKRTAGPRLSVLPTTWSAFLRHAASAE